MWSNSLSCNTVHLGTLMFINNDVAVHRAEAKSRGCAAIVRFITLHVVRWRSVSFSVRSCCTVVYDPEVNNLLLKTDLCY